MIKPLAMAKLLSIPTKVIFDGDTDKELIADEQKRNREVTQHKKENRAILNLQGFTGENEWPTNHIVYENLCCWKTNLTDTIKSEFGEYWQFYRDKASAYYDNAGDLEKNPLAVAKTLELAWADGKRSATLLELVDMIIRYARKATNC